MNHPAIQENCVAIVTGAAVGIGFAMSKRLAAIGMKVILFDVNQTLLDIALDKISEIYPTAELKAIVGDVSDANSRNMLYEQAVSFGDISLIVNNAAVMKEADPWESSPNWHDCMEVNFWSVLAMQQLFTDYLLKQNYPSAIVNLGSKEGITTPPGNAAYSVSKAAVKILTEQLAYELRESSNPQVSAHLLIPGYTFTPMNYPEMTEDTVKPTAMWSADQVVERMLEGMSRNDFYIFCEDNEVSWELDQLRLQWSADDMILNRPALSRWHPDYREKFKQSISNSLNHDQI